MELKLAESQVNQLGAKAFPPRNGSVPPALHHVLSTVGTDRFSYFTTEYYRVSQTIDCFIELLQKWYPVAQNKSLREVLSRRGGF